MTVQRVVCVYLPNWSVDRLRRSLRLRKQPSAEPREAAILLARVDHGREIVAACCPRSLRTGVKPASSQSRGNMTVTQARALIGNHPVEVKPYQPEQDAIALQRLAAWALRISPLVTADPPDSLTIDITGCEGLYPSERRLLNRIGNSLNLMGIENRIACADTIGCAWAVARFGESERSVVDSGEERTALDALPVMGLRVEVAIAEALREVNVDRIGQVLAIPRGELSARFGDELLLRIDQSLGEAMEVFEPVRPRKVIAAERIFDGAVVDIEALCIVVRELIAKVVESLKQVDRGGTRMMLTMKRLDATPIRFQAQLSHPSRDCKHLWSLLRTRVESVNMGYGVEEIALTVVQSRRITHQQSHTHEHEESSESSNAVEGGLIDTLTERLGATRTLRASVRESHRPDRVAVLSPAIAEQEKLLDKPSEPANASDRPSMLLDSPESIEVMALTPDGPVMRLQWRGQEHRVIASFGPERIGPEWWHSRNGAGDSAKRTRDYFRVQDEEGRWLWVFRECSGAGAKPGEWFIHGEWA
ncbi:MAG TPA: DNA polymerase Y family protein [Phycisphaerales bacterium]|nr:DNA polymerase Y family protein [Phycisphaerales bacterium]